MSDNKTMLPTQCTHVARGERAHAHTVVVETVDPSPADGYRYITGPDRMELCDYCAGILIGFALKLSKGQVHVELAP